MATSLVLDGRLELGLLIGDVGLVEVGALRDARELVREEEEEADAAHGEHGPGETADGSDARALLDKRLVLDGEAVEGVAALETVAEGSSLEDTGDSTEEDTGGEHEEGEGEVAEPPVGDTDDQVEDGGKETETKRMVVLVRRVVLLVVAVLVDLLRDETEERDVDAAPEDEEGEDDNLAGGREEEANAGLGLLDCGHVSRRVQCGGGIDEDVLVEQLILLTLVLLGGSHYGDELGGVGIEKEGEGVAASQYMEGCVK